MFTYLLVIQLATLLYHQATTRFDLYPFNGIRYYSAKERRTEALINGAVMVAATALTWTHTGIWIGLGGLIWTLVIVGAVLNWWLPYTTGRTFYKMPDNETWSQVYERIFATTITVLPRIGNNPRPNLEHMILHTLILSSAVLTWVYAFHM